MFAFWGALTAEEQRRLVVAASAPHYKRNDQRALIRDLDAAARALRPRTITEPMEKERIDPDAAAEWFAAMGIRVVRAKTD